MEYNKIWCTDIPLHDLALFVHNKGRWSDLDIPLLIRVFTHVVQCGFESQLVGFGEGNDPVHGVVLHAHYLLRLDIMASVAFQ